MPKRRTVSKKILITGLILLLAIGGGVAFYLNRGRDDTKQARFDQENDQETLNLAPPTEDEKRQADDNKAANDKREAEVRQQHGQQNGKNSVKPIITYAGQYRGAFEMGSQISGLSEDGGVCTATFSKDSKTFTRSVSAVAEGNATFCPMFNVDVSDFNPKGTWSVKVSYISNYSEGTSEGTNFEIK